MSRPTTLLVASLAAAAGVCMLVGCPQRRCVQSHNEVQLIPQYGHICAGTSCSLQFTHFLPVTIAVCDEWADTPARASRAVTH